MITSRSRSHESQILASGSAVRDPERDERLYDTFVKMRDLLEQYAPSWYPDALRERVEAVVQQMEN